MSSSLHSCDRKRERVRKIEIHSRKSVGVVPTLGRLPRFSNTYSALEIVAFFYELPHASCTHATRANIRVLDDRGRTTIFRAAKLSVEIRAIILLSPSVRAREGLGSRGASRRNRTVVPSAEHKYKEKRLTG